MKFLWDFIIVFVVMVLVVWLVDMIFNLSITFEEYFLRVWYYMIGFTTGWIIGRKK